jgi:micrococcal nuclease
MLAAVLGLLPAGTRSLSQTAARPPSASPIALVERVVDGDTVVVRLDGQSVKVRLIGVDAPESVDPRKPVERFARESAAFLRQLVEGKRVRLAYEPAGARIDRYGRTLAYLYRVDDDLFVNRELVARGYAFAYVKYPFRFMEDFRAAERTAREKGLGLWGPDPAARGAIGGERRVCHADGDEVPPRRLPVPGEGSHADPADRGRWEVSAVCGV